MTANINQRPNHLHVNGDSTFGHYFGSLRSVASASLTHHPHLIARFVGGLSLEVDPVTAADIVREFTLGIAKLGAVGDVSGAVAELEEGA